MDRKVQNTDESRDDLGFLALLAPEIRGSFTAAGWSHPPVWHEKSRKLDLVLSSPGPLPFQAYEALLTALRLRFHCSVDLKVEAEDPKADLSVLDSYISWLVSTRRDLAAFQSVHPWFSEDTIWFSTRDEEKHAQMMHARKALVEALAACGFACEPGVKLETETRPDVETNVLDLPEPVREAVPEKKSWKREAASEVRIQDLQVGMDNVQVEGHIFEIENRQLRSGKTLQMLYLSDYQEAIVCKRFESARCPLEELESVKKGMTVRVTGRVEYDNYAHTDTLMISRLEPVAAKKRLDRAPVKRTEFHAHSTFSEMDGVSAVEDYIQQAWDWGMPGIAVTDHAVVQAFPLAQHKVTALKKTDPDRDFTMIYGCEMNVVDPVYHIVRHPDERSLDRADYVIFDLETTGLSSREDAIIEFGAVKMKDREIVDRRQLFINPHRTIPARISQLTHISQSDVDSAASIEEVLPGLLDWIGDAVLVAHNAVFDVGFLNAACTRMGRAPLDNAVIDTLPLAHSILDIKRYNLGSVCRHYGVAYDGEGAHRADYDAEVLAGVFGRMLNQFEGKTLQDLTQLDQSSAMRKLRPFHATVYARNKEGLKSLFELITLSHTRYLSPGGEPRIPKQVLADHRENLLIGSACQNGELFELAHTRSREELEAAVPFYDFVEVQPLACYKNLVDRGTVADSDQLKTFLQYLMDAAKACGKPVLATGDAHYVHPHDKRIRDIYINSKAIGNSRHPLYKYNAQERRLLSNPDQHLRTTEEMLEDFDWLPAAQAEEIVITNPEKLRREIETIYPVKDRLYPPDIEGSDQKLRDICFDTAHKVYGPDLPEIVEKRLDRELDSIIGAGYYVVYYISHLLVKKSNEDGYLVGSRGSVGSSFVATMSNITEVNPLTPHYICKNCQYCEWISDDKVKSGFDLPDKECPHCGSVMRGDGQDIPFETFLGFNGDKVPDIDLNFSGEYQAKAHAYTKEVFGEDHVFRAGTVGTVQEKTAYGYVKGYEEEMGLEATPYNEAKRTDLAKGCEGVKRTTGQHPGGIVVVPLDMDVHDFTPVQYPANNPDAEWKTTHFDFHQIHDNILKFDILGHVDPTAMKLFERMTGMDVTTIPMNDPETMAIFSGIDSLNIDSSRYDQKTGAAGIPEFGTPFVRGILELTKPTTFAELVSISGLSHGTDVWLNNAKDLIDNGTCVLSEVIGCRDDIMIDLMNYGLPPKDSFTIMESVRKGKGLKPEWEKLMKDNSVPDWFIDSCKKIKYMFPKAHAVAYVMNAVRIAWFKVHMPVYYYCQFFSIRCDAYDIGVMMQGEGAIRERMNGIRAMRDNKTEKPSDKELAIYDTLELALEMVLRGYRFSRISMERSGATEFIPDPQDEKAIIPPFTSVDGLGANVGKSVVAARTERPFLSKEDVLRRTQLSRTLLDKLDSLGACQDLDEENQMTLF